MGSVGADASVRAHAMSRQASALRAARLAQSVFIDATGRCHHPNPDPTSLRRRAAPWRNAAAGAKR